MADTSHGPVASMPGSHHTVPPGTFCDCVSNHPEGDVLAVHRVQGETDSFGCEFDDYCDACWVACLQAQEEEPKEPCQCEWCKHETMDCRPYRDIDEGLAGRVYEVCAACRKKDADAIHKELYGDEDEDDSHLDDD
jgi:hypothetical protein